MIHIMVDIEGMNKLPQAHQTRIMQIAATPFDEKGVIKGLSSFNQFANRSYPTHTIDNPETVIWWRENPLWDRMQMKQDKLGMSPEGLILAFNQWVESVAINDDQGHVTLWACHPEYDITAIYAYMSKFDITPAWPFYRVKDYATVRDRFKDAIQHENVTHWADEDVLRQIRVLQRCCQLGWSL